MGTGIDLSIVKIIAERIMSGGKNPQKDRAYKLSDISNKMYKDAVESYIERQSE